MPEPREGQEITRLLAEWRGGNRAALDELSPIVHQELKRIAVAHMRRESSGYTIQPTALIDEAYARLLAANSGTFTNRAHFFGVAAQIMRKILVDFANHRVSAKAGGAMTDDLNVAMQVSLKQYEEVLAVHRAIDRLTALDPHKGRVMELRHFGGLSREEIAEVTGMDPETIRRDMQLAGAWLKREMSPASNVEA